MSLLQNKKIVLYKGESMILKGASAYVTPVDHPDCSNTTLVRTSTVIRIGENGEFETLNTLYRKQL